MRNIYHISRFTLQTGMYDIKNAYNSFLIRICDPGTRHAKPYSDFGTTLDLEFLDAEDTCGFAEADKFSINQANQVTALLYHAYVLESDVYVQCEQGVSRSSAIAHAAQLCGFTCKTTSYADPNQRVLAMLGCFQGVRLDLPH